MVVDSNRLDRCYHRIQAQHRPASRSIEVPARMPAADSCVSRTRNQLRSIWTCSRDWSKRLGRLEQVVDENGGRRLTIAWPGLAADDPLELGESVAVSGCCLTVTAATESTFAVQAGPETLERTNLEQPAGRRPPEPRASAQGGRSAGGPFCPGSYRHDGHPARPAAGGRVGVSRVRHRTRLDAPAGTQRINRRRRSQPHPGRRLGPTPSRSCSFPTRWP